MLVTRLLIRIWAFCLLQYVFNYFCLSKKDCEYKRVPSLCSYDFGFNNINHFRVSLLCIKQASLRFPLTLSYILIKINFIKKMLYCFILWQEGYFHSLFLHAFKLVINISIQLHIFYLLSFQFIYLATIYVFIRRIQFVSYDFKIFHESFIIWFHY